MGFIKLPKFKKKTTEDKPAKTDTPRKFYVGWCQGAKVGQRMLIGKNIWLITDVYSNYCYAASKPINMLQCFLMWINPFERIHIKE